MAGYLSIRIMLRRFAISVTFDNSDKGNNCFAARDAAVQGLGIAQLPLVVAQDRVGQGALLAVLPKWKRPDVPVHAVFPSARYLTPKVRAFIDLGLEAF